VFGLWVIIMMVCSSRIWGMVVLLIFFLGLYCGDIVKLSVVDGVSI